MPIQHPTYALPLQSANTIATKQSHDAELNRVVTILVENDRDLNATFERAIVTGPIVGEWDAGTGAFPTLRPNGDQIRVGDTWRVTGNGTVDGQAFYSGDYLQAITAGGGVTFNGNWARAALGQIEADRIAAETAAAEAQAYAEMAEFTRVTVIASGDGTANPITLPISVDSALRVQVFVNMTRWVPGDDYTVSGYDLAPVSPLVWPDGDRNLLILIDRPFDSEAPTSDDVTHDGQPISKILDRIDAQNTFYLSDYLHPDDMAAVIAGSTAGQTGARVTAAIRQCFEEAIAAVFATDGASIVVDVPQGIYRINDRLMSDTFNNALWSGGNTRSRLWFRTDGAVTFRVQNWAPGRAAMRTDGIYAGSSHIAPIAVFEWFQPTGRQNFGGMSGQWIIEGADNTATDPMGWYFYRLNATHVLGNIECRELRNRNFVFDSVFNSKFDFVRSAADAGLMLTECGGTGLLPNDTVAGTVRTGLRYTVSGTTLTINTMVYDSAGPSYAYTPYSVFTADHVGKWIALDRQGVENLLGDDIDDGNEGGSTRRSARWFQIASVTDGSTVELTEAPPYQTSTGQWVPQNRTFSFEVLKVSVTAGSTAAILSMPVTQSLVGLEVVIPGAGYSGGPTTLPDLVAMVTAHSGASVTLSHAARISKSGVPFVAAPQVALSSLSHTALAATSRKCDDLHFGCLWCESGTAPGLPLHLHNVTNVTLGDESKLHGSPLTTPNFGGNFACVLGGEIGARLAGRFTHSRHSRQFGMFYITGDRSEIKVDGELSSWTADNGSAIWYLDPANAATTRIWDIYYNASDYATGYPNISGGQVFERGGSNWTPGRIKAGASQRSPRGERPAWPQAALPAVRAPALGGARDDAVSAVARGWVPDDGVPYIIGGGLFEGASGDTSVPNLPGLKGYGPYVTPEQYGAVGDGVADDTAAFMAALRSKITVRCISDKTYLVNDIDVRQDEWLDLNGATLKPYSSACNYVVRLRGNRARIFDGSIVDDQRITLKTATVTAGASAGGTVITVDNIGGIAERMILLVRSNTLNAFTCQSVASISGNTITLAQGADADIPVGAKVYASYGLLSVYHNGNVNDVQISGLSITGGGIGILHKAWTSGKTISGAMHNNVYMNGQIIAGMAITGQSKDHNYTGLDISTNGGISQQFTVTGTVGQTSLDIVALGAELPLGQLWMSYEIDFLINGVAQDFNIAGPAAGKYGMSTDGTVLSFPALAGGEELKVNVRPSCAFGIYINSAGSDLSVVSGAHRFVRCLMLGQVIGVRADSTATSLGLLHWTQVQADSSRMRNWWFTNVGNVHGTHFFCGFAPEPLVIDLADTDRVQNFTHLHTRQESKLWFNQAWASAGKAITINAPSAAAAVRDGLPKVSVGHWAGPTYSIHDPYNAVSLGGRALLKGTYTVTLSDGTNLSPTTATGRWTMVGPERVCVEFDALSGIDTTGMTGTSSMRIGLPFKALDFQTIGLIGLANMPSKQGRGTNLMARVGANQTYAQVQNYGEASGGTLTQRVDNFNGATIVNFSLTYNIAR